MAESSASPIWPSSPATRPAPKTMNTAIPCAVAVMNTEASTEIAATSAAASASASAGQDEWSGVQSPNARVSTRAIAKTTST